MSAEDDLISLIMQGTAFPINTETMFLATTGGNGMRSYQRPSRLYNTISFLLSKLIDKEDLQQRLLLEMLNQGNFMDIYGEIKKQEELGENSQGHVLWRSLAKKAIDLLDNQNFHFKRIYIMQQPFVELGGESRDQAIKVTKELCDLPSNCNWDAISYKIPPRGSAYFCMLYPGLLEKLSQSDIAIIDQAQVEIDNALRAKFSEARELDETKQDELFPDYSMFIEQRVAAVYDEQKKNAIQESGDMNLIQYVIASTQAFVQGIMPGGISPGKITACQDLISMTELQATIQQIASQQITQAGEIMPHPAVRRGIKYKAEKSGLQESWTLQQVGSLNQAASITQQLTANFRDPIDPQQKLEQQLAGGANTLIDQFNMERQGQVIRLTPIDSEMLRQCLSVMIAAIRVRFDATESTKTELVAQEDVDHLWICERLAQYVEPNAQEFFKRVCTVLINTITKGHNQVKISRFTPDVSWQRDAVDLAVGKAEVLLRAIPLIDADLQEGKLYFEGLFSSIMMALCDKDRINRQIKERQTRRVGVYKSFKAYQ